MNPIRSRAGAICCLLIGCAVLVGGAVLGGCGGVAEPGLPDIIGVIISPDDDFTAHIGDVVPFWAFGELAEGGSANITHLVTWDTSNPSAGEFSPQGEFTALAEGEPDVTATYGSLVSDSTKVTIISVPDQPTAQYYPLLVGNWWEYTGTPVTPQGIRLQQDITLTTTVTRQIAAAGKVWYEMRITYTDPNDYRYMYLHHDGEGLAELRGDDSTIHHLKAPIEVGNQWPDPDDPEQDFVIESVTDTRTVPAGTYENCVKVRWYRITAGGDDYYIDTWFAPNVGIVESRFPEDDPAGTWIEQKLVEFHPASP